MKKTWFKRLNHSVLKKKTPLLGLTVLQLFILFLVINGGAVAVILSQRQQPVTQNTGVALPAYDTDTTVTTQTKNTAPQDNTQKSSSTQSSTNSTPKVSSSLPDQYGCIPQTSGYDSCVKYAKQNALTLWCSDMERAAYAKYSAVGDKAWATRDSVLAEWKTVYARMVQQNYPLNAINSEEARYKKMAYTDTNAIIKPAYAEYVATLNSIRSQGCEVTAYSDLYSWPGY